MKLNWHIVGPPNHPGAVHPGLPVAAPPAAGLRRLLPSGPVRLEEALPLLLPAAAACHHDREPGAHRVDHQGHELLNGESCNEASQKRKTKKVSPRLMHDCGSIGR